MHDNVELSMAFFKYVILFYAQQLRFHALEIGELRREALERA